MSAGFTRQPQAAGVQQSSKQFSQMHFTNRFRNLSSCYEAEFAEFKGLANAS
jgi:hypothetical protein